MNRIGHLPESAVPLGWAPCRIAVAAPQGRGIGSDTPIMFPSIPSPVIRRRANVRAIMENYPSTPEVTTRAVIGSTDQWVSTPVRTVLRIMGTGDVYTILSRLMYPNDPRPWHLATVIGLRDGKVVKETTIFGAAFDPPEWRARWVERM